LRPGGHQDGSPVWLGQRIAQQHRPTGAAAAGAGQRVRQILGRYGQHQQVCRARQIGQRAVGRHVTHRSAGPVDGEKPPAEAVVAYRAQDLVAGATVPPAGTDDGDRPRHQHPSQGRSAGTAAAAHRETSDRSALFTGG
jgi:hypothetical protein